MKRHSGARLWEVGHLNDESIFPVGPSLAGGVMLDPGIWTRLTLLKHLDLHAAMQKFYTLLLYVKRKILT